MHPNIKSYDVYAFFHEMRQHGTTKMPFLQYQV